jgi:hypothetical protein
MVGIWDEIRERRVNSNWVGAVERVNGLRHVFCIRHTRDKRNMSAVGRGEELEASISITC